MSENNKLRTSVYIC